MKKYSYTELEQEFTRLGYSWPTVHIIGVRSKANENNKFDDNFYIINGPGQYVDAYQLGLHKGQYEALVQRKPVTVYRDNDKDETAEEQGKEDTGLFGINIHRANPNAISSLIEKWSAGCQVLNDPKDFATLIATCKASGKKTFTYTLLREF